VITLSGAGPARYRVGENRLTRLARDGTDIGSSTGNYVLLKQGDGIAEKYWKLVEVNGRPVPRLDREPQMTLRTDGNRVTGFGGCNHFTGSYRLDAAVLRIRFEQIAATMRACLTGMDTEAAFLAALRGADNYSLNGDVLSLNRARMAPLARFEAVYMR
jgi:heat shock protein HslJ